MGALSRERHMPDILTQRDLLAELRKQISALGLNVLDDSQEGLTGEAESIRAKWWLGGRKVSYRMSCRPKESEHTVDFREAVIERSWGIPPPTLSVETTSVSGWKRSGTRKDISIGGGGSIDFAKVRNAVEAATAAAGWNFHLVGGRMP